LETTDKDNENCKLVEIGVGTNGRYVTDRGLCEPASTAAVLQSVSDLRLTRHLRADDVDRDEPGSRAKNHLRGGTGPLPSARSTGGMAKAHSWCPIKQKARQRSHLRCRAC